MSKSSLKLQLEITNTVNLRTQAVSVANSLVLVVVIEKSEAPVRSMAVITGIIEKSVADARL